MTQRSVRMRDRRASALTQWHLSPEQRVLVEGLNLVKRHTPSQGQGQPGGIVTKEAPVHLSAVSLIDPVQQVPTRVKWGFLEDGTKVRISSQSGAIVPKPDGLKDRRHPRPHTGPRDTAPEVVAARTVSEQDDTLHAALRSLTILGDAGHVLANGARAGSAKEGPR